MLENNKSAERQTTDITAALEKLVEAGCSESEITGFARLRARYARVPDHIHDYPASLSKQEKINLTFYRWLLQNGRIKP